MSLTLHLGPVASGKTSALLHHLASCVLQRKKCLLVRPTMDNRWDTTRLTHDGKIGVLPEDIVRCAKVEYSEVRCNKLSELKIAKDVENIFIDEYHFFSDVDEWKTFYTTQVKESKRNIIAAGIRADYKMNIIPSLTYLMGVVDTPVFHNAWCMKCGEVAPHSAKVIQNHTGETLIPGGLNVFEPRCRICFEL